MRTVSKASSTFVESRAEVSRNNSPLFSVRKGNTPVIVGSKAKGMTLAVHCVLSLGV